MTPDKPLGFLKTLLDQTTSTPHRVDALAAAADWARSSGAVPHILGTTSGSAHEVAALQAAGARAIAASLAVGADPLVLLAAADLDAPAGAFAESLTKALQGYERIHALAAPLTQRDAAFLVSPAGMTGHSSGDGMLFWAILISAPTELSPYWQPKS